MWLPPKPANSASGNVLRSERIRLAACRSPLGSPAEMKIRIGHHRFLARRDDVGPLSLGAAETNRNGKSWKGCSLARSPCGGTSLPQSKSEDEVVLNI